MSIAQIAAARRGRLSPRPASRLMDLARVTWAALTAWNERRRAIGHLMAMHDAQLRDIGIDRSDVEAAVRGRLDVTHRRCR